MTALLDSPGRHGNPFSVGGQCQEWTPTRLFKGNLQTLCRQSVQSSTTSCQEAALFDAVKQELDGKSGEEDPQHASHDMSACHTEEFLELTGSDH